MLHLKVLFSSTPVDRLDEVYSVYNYISYLCSCNVIDHCVACLVGFILFFATQWLMILISCKQKINNGCWNLTVTWIGSEPTVRCTGQLVTFIWCTPLCNYATFIVPVTRYVCFAIARDITLCHKINLLISSVLALQRYFSDEYWNLVSFPSFST